MNKTIWKFELHPFSIGTQIVVQIPQGGSVLCADIDPIGDPCLWALVDPEKESEGRRFVVYGTGQEVANAHILSHISTCKAGPFVWHIFEIMAPPVK
jgi:hypothetical protein